MSLSGTCGSSLSNLTTLAYNVGTAASSFRV
jgi:hypothetical protein